MKTTDRYVFFLRGVLGNWIRVPGGIRLRINEREVNLPTSEHVFMALKASYFNDENIFEKIINTPSPKEAKRLGRLVKGFDESLWKKVREEAMYSAIKHRSIYDIKFTTELLNPEYEGKEFVECNPYDVIWSCGWSEDNENALDSNNWRGLNLLGKLLTKLRKELKK